MASFAFAGVGSEAMTSSSIPEVRLSGYVLDHEQPHPGEEVDQVAFTVA